MTQPVGGYVRHRPRMVRESVYFDVHDTLVRGRWLEGTTADGSVHTTADQTLGLLEGSPLVLIDYFPEADGEALETPLNTFALDIGEQGELVEAELGAATFENNQGGLWLQPYTFNMAFYAKTDAVAVSVMTDLRDRFLGWTDSPYISLYNYLSATPTLITRMEVENFRYARDTQNVAPHEVHLFFAALEITDYVDQGSRQGLETA